MIELECDASEGRSTNARAAARYKARKTAKRRSHIAVLDTETTPFDNTRPDIRIAPFLAVLYSDQFDPIIIWDEDEEAFIARLVKAIEDLPDTYTIYAHNGGKFDFMFLLSRLRGRVSFKGRGIMDAKIGAHSLRDSFHLIPERLANYKKDDFDYSKLKAGVRNLYKEEIITYCVHDCAYLFDIVKTFVDQNGLRLSIGQAAIYELRKLYKVENIGVQMDDYLRQFFFGGRVECIAGKGIYTGDYKLYDVNSMYPYVMATRKHPVGSDYVVRAGEPGVNTVFVDLTCINHGALIGKTDEGETTANIGWGRFKTTIWEYETALQYGLIDMVVIHACVDCVMRTDFSEFVVPRYQKRLETKKLLKSLDPGSEEYNTVKKDDIFTKLFLNNAYGKFAQDPRRFKETFLTDPNSYPDDGGEWGDLPAFEAPGHWVWERPVDRLRFNNVGTAASITGAARAVLLEAIVNAVDPIYCDTDSVICRELRGHVLDGQKLGAWDEEARYSEVIVAGKKLYGCRLDGQESATKVRSKGASGLKWNDLEALLDGEIITALQKGVTMTKRGDQYYMARRIRATAGARGVISTRGLKNADRLSNGQRTAPAGGTARDAG